MTNLFDAFSELSDRAVLAEVTIAAAESGHQDG
jgi:hypothetical protein